MSALGSLVNNRVDKIIRWENGEMDRDEAVAFFQELINNGSAWELQGIYGRVAISLIRSGDCVAPTAN